MLVVSIRYTMNSTDGKAYILKPDELVKGAAGRTQSLGSLAARESEKSSRACGDIEFNMHICTDLYVHLFSIWDFTTQKW